MGTSIRAKCTCGFSAAFTIGGGMRSHLSQAYFPYRCSPCGLVSVNIAADELVCPRNKAHKISRIAGSRSKRLTLEQPEQFGSPSIWKRFSGWLGFGEEADRREPTEGTHVVCQWGDHELYDHPYECPYCKDRTLYFEATGMRFD